MDWSAAPGSLRCPPFPEFCRSIRLAAVARFIRLQAFALRAWEGSIWRLPAFFHWNFPPSPPPKSLVVKLGRNLKSSKSATLPFRFEVPAG